MAQCEDYPCCGHGPPTGISPGDGGGCPDEDGCFDCVECGGKLPKHSPSSICTRCRNAYADMDQEDREYHDMERERRERDSW